MTSERDAVHDGRRIYDALIARASYRNLAAEPMGGTVQAIRTLGSALARSLRGPGRLAQN